MPASIACTLPQPQSAAVGSLPGPAPLPSVTYVVRGRPGPLDRPAMPSGHPETWGAITQGTLLDQSVYPFPIFLDLPR